MCPCAGCDIEQGGVSSWLKEREETCNYTETWTLFLQLDRWQPADTPAGFYRREQRRAWPRSHPGNESREKYTRVHLLKARDNVQGFRWLLGEREEVARTCVHCHQSVGDTCRIKWRTTGPAAGGQGQEMAQVGNALAWACWCLDKGPIRSSPNTWESRRGAGGLGCTWLNLHFTHKQRASIEILHQMNFSKCPLLFLVRRYTCTKAQEKTSDFKLDLFYKVFIV